MKSVLFVITSDPRTSARPAEAVRMAAGLSAWKKVAVSIYLRDAALLILRRDPEHLMDEEHFERYLPILIEGGHRIRAQKQAPMLEGVDGVSFEEISESELAALAAEASHVLRF